MRVTSRFLGRHLRILTKLTVTSLFSGRHLHFPSSAGSPTLKNSSAKCVDDPWNPSTYAYLCGKPFRVLRMRWCLRRIMRKLWLITTEHLKAGLWFRDEEDFKVGMNFVALQAHASRVVVLSFILMSNHVHFVVKADSKKDAEAFIEGFKHRYSLYLRYKYGVKEFLRGNDVQVDLISPYDEDPEKAIAYVEMNCVAAGICSHPSQYPWGTGGVFFNSRKPAGRPVGVVFQAGMQTLAAHRHRIAP